MKKRITVKELYSKLIAEIKSHGYKVYHGNRNLNTAIVQHYPKRYIHLYTKIRNTKYGCNILAHELGHIRDFKKGKFKKIREKYWDKPYPLTLIIDVEWSAISQAKKYLEKEGFKANYKEYNKDYFLTNGRCMPWFIEYYNYIRLGRSYYDYCLDWK